MKKWLFIVSYTCLIALVCIFDTVAQEFKISANVLPSGALKLSFPSDSVSYYVLLSGLESGSITQRTSAVLGTNVSGSFEQIISSARSMFFTIQRIPRRSPTDLDNDGIDDVYELSHGSDLNPLDRSDATLPYPPTPNLTWLQKYQRDVIDGQPTTVGFPIPMSTVLADEATATVPITFSKPFTGTITYQIGGTAVPGLPSNGGDFFFPSGSISVNNRSTAEISIPLVPHAWLAGDRTIVLSLTTPPNAAYQLIPGKSVHQIKITQSDAGVFSGVMTVTNGFLLGSQSITLALRSLPGGGFSAIVDTSRSTLFQEPLRVGANFGPDGSLSFLAPIKGGFGNGVFLRPVTWNLSLGTMASTNGILSGPFSLDFDGLSAAGRTDRALGTLILTKLY